MNHAIRLQMNDFGSRRLDEELSDHRLAVYNKMIPLAVYNKLQEKIVTETISPQTFSATYTIGATAV